MQIHSSNAYVTYSTQTDAHAPKRRRNCRPLVLITSSGEDIFLGPYSTKKMKQKPTSHNTNKNNPTTAQSEMPGCLCAENAAAGGEVAICLDQQGKHGNQNAEKYEFGSYGTNACTHDSEYSCYDTLIFFGIG